MPINPSYLLSRPFAPVEQHYTERDSMLYALGCGVGANPLDAGALRYVYERAEGGLQALPTLVNVLGYSGFWADQADTGISWQQLVHAEQAITLHRPVPAQGHVIGHSRVVGLHDKGADKGALMLHERQVVDAASNALLATVVQTTMLRGDGGFDGAHGMALPAPHVLPIGSPDAVCDLATLPQAALLYRLNGDFNPLHADPAVALAAQFERPILHGLASMGVAVHAVLKAVLNYDATGVRAVRVRFTAPVFPGETLRTEIWRDGAVVSFRSTALERGVVVLNAGRLDLA